VVAVFVTGMDPSRGTAHLNQKVGVNTRLLRSILSPVTASTFMRGVLRRKDLPLILRPLGCVYTSQM
jgi:hypothetical protein